MSLYGWKKYPEINLKNVSKTSWEVKKWYVVVENSYTLPKPDHWKFQGDKRVPKGGILQRLKNITEIFQGVIVALLITKASKD